MSSEIHWEWRGFGVVSSRFVDSYAELKTIFEPQNVEDLYLWIPQLEVNAKFRKGAEGGLKFKRIKSKDGNLEKWGENPQEIFDFPLEKLGWEMLSKMLASASMVFPNYPHKPPNRTTTIAHLKDAGCITVLVQKLREGRIWQGPNGKVKVEWACISQPQTILSIGLETWDETSGEAKLSDDQTKKDIISAIEQFGLEKEPLKVMNYMNAVATWASGEKL